MSFLRRLVDADDREDYGDVLDGNLFDNPLYLGFGIVSGTSFGMLLYIFFCRGRSRDDEYYSEGGMRTKVRHEVSQVYL